MSTAGSARTATDEEDLPERRVTPLELFFDLVFVFALTQVTGFLADHLSWTGMLEGPLCSSCCVGVGLRVADQRRARRGGDSRLVGYPDGDGGHARGFACRPRRLRRYGVLFGLSYFVVRLLHVVLFVLASGVPPEAIQPCSGSRRAFWAP